MTTLIVRKATLDDAHDIFDVRIAAILDQCQGFYPASDLEAWTRGSPSERFRTAVEQRFYVATIADVVVGSGMIDLASGQLDAIFVHPDYLRQGVGRAMVAFLEDLARLHDLECLKLDSTLNAAPFYRRLGFEGTIQAEHVTQSGLALACIPMEKKLR